MKGIIVIKKEEGMVKKMGPKIPICDCILEDAEDGDEVEFEGKGIVMVKDGKRFLMLSELEGEGMEAMEESHSEDMNTWDSEDALMNFIKKLG